MKDNIDGGFVEVYIVSEDQTEQRFIKDVLSEYLAPGNIFLRGLLCDKRGGAVNFDRFSKEIERLLKARPDVYVSTFVDFYGMGANWPGLSRASKGGDAKTKARLWGEETVAALKKASADPLFEARFIPYVSMHEFEALVFADPEVLVRYLKLNIRDAQKILAKYPSPEDINDSPATAPSKRLAALTNGTYKKTIDGINIVKLIGIDAIRARCAAFDQWVETLENLKPLRAANR